MWIRPLRTKIKKNIIILYAPNYFVLDWIQNKYINYFQYILHDLCNFKPPVIIILIKKKINSYLFKKKKENFIPESQFSNLKNHFNAFKKFSGINKKYNFHNFIEGESNQLARYSSYQLASNFKQSYNPLFLYGSTGLGKTHLLHAIGNSILKEKKYAKVAYMHSECFIQNMINALKKNTIEKFKNYYRSVDVLLIDDIQFFSKKKHSQDELFHTFNTLFEKKQKIILTSNCYPKRIKGLSDLLKSRFNWGLTVSITAPKINTRVKILLYKAHEKKILLPKEVALFIAKKIYSNVRELEGALNKIQIKAHFNKKKITLELAKKTLKNAIQKKKISIKNIQNTVVEYFKIKISDLISKKRSRSITEPRQIAMALSKKLTNYSFSEIGFAFGGKDHTTVLYACKKIKNSKKNKKNYFYQDFLNILNKLIN